MRFAARLVAAVVIGMCFAGWLFRTLAGHSNDDNRVAQAAANGISTFQRRSSALLTAKSQPRRWQMPALRTFNDSASDKMKPPSQVRDDVVNVEVWGKAAIGDYFIEHIVGAQLESKLNGIWFLARFGCGAQHRLTYRSGHGVATHKVPTDPQYVVLVLNGHDDDHAATAQPWLEHLLTLAQLKAAGIVVLGYEDCSNGWLQPFVDDARYKIAFTYMVYGGQTWLAKSNVYKWPLGVATYRGFPKEIDYYRARGPVTSSIGSARRRWLCNLQATIYDGSSREQLLAVIEGDSMIKQQCFVEARRDWHSSETPESAKQYQELLLTSDYTLAPVGQNSECYRWYEAAASGSIPIVEDRVQPPVCGGDPLQLLKESEAPFIYIKDWAALPSLLKELRQRSDIDLMAHRRAVVEWYDHFRLWNRNRFCASVTQRFA